jgi:hypothetical protein
MHYLLTWSNGFCSGRSKRGALVGKGKGPWQRNDFILLIIFINFFGEEKMKTREDKRMVKLDFFLNLFKIAFLGIC